jgi:hypothetical protein
VRRHVRRPCRDCKFAQSTCPSLLNSP